MRSAQPEERTELLLGEVVATTGGGACLVGEMQTRSSGQQGIRDKQYSTYTAMGTQPPVQGSQTHLRAVATRPCAQMD